MTTYKYFPTDTEQEVSYDLSYQKAYELLSNSPTSIGMQADGFPSGVCLRLDIEQNICVFSVDTGWDRVERDDFQRIMKAKYRIINDFSKEAMINPYFEEHLKQQAECRTTTE